MYELYEIHMNSKGMKPEKIGKMYTETVSLTVH